MFVEILQNPSLTSHAASFAKENLMNEFHAANSESQSVLSSSKGMQPITSNQPSFIQSASGQPVLLKDDELFQHEEIEEELNISVIEKELIIKALKKHKSKRKDASIELGISERTLYRKLKEYDIDDL